MKEMGNFHEQKNFAQSPQGGLLPDILSNSKEATVVRGRIKSR